jgi:hypothetical protein
LGDSTESVGDFAAPSDSLDGPSEFEDSDAPAGVPSTAESLVDGATGSLEFTPNGAIDSSSSDNAVSLTPEPGIQVDDGSDQPSAGEQSTVEFAPSVGGVSGYIPANSTADSFVQDEDVRSGADFADATDDSESRSVTESTADPWISQMMAIHPRGASFYGPPDDLAGGDDADASGSTEDAPQENKPFIGPLRGSDGEDPAEQWMRYYQAVHDAARNPRIYTNDRPIPSEDSLALPLALPVTLRHMTPLVERLIGRTAIEIHQVCQELVKYEIDQFKFELHAEMRALW